MAQLRDLLPLLREKCTGMLEQQAMDQLKKAYRNFCLESGYVQQTEVFTRQTDGTISLDADIDYYIGSVNVVIDTKSGKELAKGIDYKVDVSNKVTIAQGYDEVQVTFSIVPTLPMVDNIEANDDICRRWPDELAAGAASLLRLMPNQPWSDVALADFYKRDFVKGYREAFRIRVEANDEIQFQTTSSRIFF